MKRIIFLYGLLWLVVIKSSAQGDFDRDKAEISYWKGMVGQPMDSVKGYQPVVNAHDPLRIPYKQGYFLFSEGKDDDHRRSWYVNPDSNRRIVSVVVAFGSDTLFGRQIIDLLGDTARVVSFNGANPIRRWKAGDVDLLLAYFEDLGYFIMSKGDYRSFYKYRFK